MRFLAPENGIWLLGLPLAVSFWLLHVRGKQAFRRSARIGATLRVLSRLSSTRSDLVGLAVTLTAVTAVVAAAMRPQLFLELRTPRYERQDVVLILDRSASMRATDIAPSRFARAVAEIRTFLAEKPDEIERVALVGFAGTSLTLSHLTRDVDSLFFYLDWILEDPDIHFGTDLGAALVAARDLVAKDERDAKTFFLVLSDGDDGGEALSGALNSLHSDEIRVHAIGIGGEREMPIPIAGEDGVSSYLDDGEGGLVTTRFDETALRRIALQTGGRYLRSTSGRELAEAMSEVLSHQRRLAGFDTSSEYRDVHRPLLALAAVATVLLLVAA